VNKAFCLGFAAYLLPTFPLGYAWHLVIFADQYHRLDMYRAEVIIPMGLASMLIQACFFSWAYPRLFGAESGQWRRNVFKGIAIFSALAISFAVLPVAAKYRMMSVPDFLLLECAFAVLQFAIVTPLIALAHRKPG
jgi:hypothetical protein